jgi:hypothetical protein
MWSATQDGVIGEDVVAGRDPQIAPPKSLDDIGRRWTIRGPDVPARNAR